MMYTHIEQSLSKSLVFLYVHHRACWRGHDVALVARTPFTRTNTPHIHICARSPLSSVFAHTYAHAHTHTQSCSHGSMYTSEISMTRSRHGTRGHARMWNSFLFSLSFFLSILCTSIFPLFLSWNVVAKAWRKTNTNIATTKSRKKWEGENMDTIWVWPHRWLVQWFFFCYGTCVWNVWKRENKRAKVQDERGMSWRQVLTFSASMEARSTNMKPPPGTRNQIPKTRSCGTRAVCVNYDGSE